MPSNRLTAQFSPAWWCPGPHFQTFWATLVRPRCNVTYRRELVETPDGDELVLDHIDGPAGSPIVLLLHGLEGSSLSAYMQGMAEELCKLGWRAVAMNFRTCARDLQAQWKILPNRLPRLYHSAETDDLAHVVRLLRARDPQAPLHAVGTSFGANVLLKWLGESPATNLLCSAAAICAPFDPARVTAHLETRLGRIYCENFLRTLRPKTFELVARFPQLASRLDLERVRRSGSIREFDEAVTAPLHGFASADDYYEQAASIRYIGSIEVPTLCINAEDDPLYPPGILADAVASASKAVQVLVTPGGGHVGFVTGDAPWRASYWHEQTVLHWLRHCS